jgi:hypothetical protein
MSCKKPVFMAIDGVSRKLVEDAQARIYVEPENPEEYKKAIDFLSGKSCKINRTR